MAEKLEKQTKLFFIRLMGVVWSVYVALQMQKLYSCK